MNIDWLHIESVTQHELEEHLESILNRVDSGISPLLIIRQNESVALLFEWEDYWSRFAGYYPPGEKERVEAKCQERYES